MEDKNIIALYFQRSEQAIAETDKKYGGYCFQIAYNILSNPQDSEECVSDTYLETWNRIPPTRPNIFSAFLAKLTRHISIDRWRRLSAQKRGGGEIPLALEELDICAKTGNPETALERRELMNLLNRFLNTLPETERNVFLCRYWYLDPVSAICQYTGFSESKVTSMLFRTRNKLRRELRQAGY